MRRARKSGALRPSGRLLEFRSDSEPRGMIAALCGCGVSVQIGARAARRTKSGLQAHPLIFCELRTLNAKHDTKHDRRKRGMASWRRRKLRCPIRSPHTSNFGNFLIGLEMVCMELYSLAKL
jgi:hypothetical protein